MLNVSLDLSTKKLDSCSELFLENLIRDAVTYTEHTKRKTVTAIDVMYALKRQVRTLTYIKSMLQEILEPVLVKLYIYISHVSNISFLQKHSSQQRLS